MDGTSYDGFLVTMAMNPRPHPAARAVFFRSSPAWEMRGWVTKCFSYISHGAVFLLSLCIFEITPPLICENLGPENSIFPIRSHLTFYDFFLRLGPLANP